MRKNSTGSQGGEKAQEQKDLADFIDKWLAKNHCTTGQLAERAEIPQSVLSHIKAGAVPRSSTIRKLATAMGESVAKLNRLAGNVRDEDMPGRVVQLTHEEHDFLKGYRQLSRYDQPAQEAQELVALLLRRTDLPQVEWKELSLTDWLDRWLDLHNTTAKSLAMDAGIPHSSITQIKQGAIPQPDTLRKLARAMGIPPAWLFIAGGYLDPENGVEIADLTPEEGILLGRFRKLSHTHRIFVEGVIQGMLQLPLAHEE